MLAAGVAGEKAEPASSARGVGAYLGLAVGDALGATVEFMTPREIRHQYGVHREIIGGGWLRLRPGQVTDDTEMTLALGRSVLRRGGVDPADAAEVFSEWMRSKPVDIGHTVRRGIAHYRRTRTPEVAPDEQNAGNGACMRCLPIALLCRHEDEQALIRASRAQAHITHNNPVADAGTETVLRMLVTALNGGGSDRMRLHAERLVARYPVFRFDRRPVENPSGWIVETLQAVFQALYGHDSFEEILVDVVNRGGDADTTGAIAGMLAGALYGIHAIPGRWSRKLDPEVRRSCEGQAIELLALAGRGSA